MASVARNEALGAEDAAEAVGTEGAHGGGVCLGEVFEDFGGGEEGRGLVGTMAAEDVPEDFGGGRGLLEGSVVALEAFFESGVEEGWGSGPDFGKELGVELFVGDGGAVDGCGDFDAEEAA